MQTEIGNSIKSCIGSLCEILNEENKLLFVGYLQRYNPNNNEITVELNKDGISPRSQVFRDKVKLQLHRAKNKEMVQVFFGSITGTSNRVWKIELQEASVHTETRQNFRQRVSCSATTVRMWNEHYSGSPKPCQLLDISLGGLCFYSKTKYILRERLVFSDVQLRPQGPKYTFHCIVKRIQPDSKKEGFLYGCQFYDLSEQDENFLCQDIFYIQSKELNQYRHGI